MQINLVSQAQVFQVLFELHRELQYYSDAYQEAVSRPLEYYLNEKINRLVTEHATECVVTCGNYKSSKHKRIEIFEKSLINLHEYRIKYLRTKLGQIQDVIDSLYSPTGVNQDQLEEARRFAFSCLGKRTMGYHGQPR